MLEHKQIKNEKFLLKNKRAFTRQTKRGRAHAPRMRITPAGRLYSPLANEQDTTGPGQSPAQDVFF